MKGGARTVRYLVPRGRLLLPPPLPRPLGALVAEGSWVFSTALLEGGPSPASAVLVRSQAVPVGEKQ